MASGPLALLGATIIDGTGAPPIPDGAIVVRNGRIAAVGRREQIEVPAQATVVNAGDLTLLPGLIDSHVHVLFAMPESLRGLPDDAAVNAVLREFLRHGITTIRDVGAAFPWIVEIARSIESGRRIGPRILSAGPIFTAPGGHPAGTLLKGSYMAIASGTRQVATPGDARAAVREVTNGGVDCIKIVFDSGNPQAPSPLLDIAVLNALVEEAREVGLPAIVHWGNVNELKPIIAARPAQLEHSGRSAMSDADIKGIVEAQIAVDPTLSVMSSVLSPEQFASAMNNVKRLAAAGAVITAGTDAPLHGLPLGASLHRELELLVEAGLSPMQAIQAATVRPARLMHRNDVGTIEPGMIADIIGVSGNPLHSISDIRMLRLVVRDGRIFESELAETTVKRFVKH